MSIPPSWCGCTPVKYNRYHQKNISSQYHSCNYHDPCHDDRPSEASPNVKKCRLDSRHNTYPNNSHNDDNHNDSSENHTMNTTSHGDTTICNTSSSNSSSSETMLYYSRYTTARLRASTPNQRSPLYARQLRF